VLNINMLDSSVKLIVLCEGNGALVVPVDDCSTETGIVVRVNLAEEAL
jgi:hypothetical protein